MELLIAILIEWIQRPVSELHAKWLLGECICPETTKSGVIVSPKIPFLVCLDRQRSVKNLSLKPRFTMGVPNDQLSQSLRGYWKAWSFGFVFEDNLPKWTTFEYAIRVTDDVFGIYSGLIPIHWLYWQERYGPIVRLRFFDPDPIGQAESLHDPDFRATVDTRHFICLDSVCVGWHEMPSCKFGWVTIGLRQD
ncbi:hypothetical protein [Tuwongella immobilis]|uniref:Uncharacterized protein n=1 Tax=Tuwongella immobilis TaxID=692036 RepID=A0A6C2YTT9_9BACT|nr:hypothetical protein [Tuwongella immobilis]VIP05158.1 unnamed protein product [Tuwongella immobilis]VTS07672.1 unnamed protein product [Tuwongella immobilis]